MRVSTHGVYLIRDKMQVLLFAESGVGEQCLPRIGSSKWVLGIADDLLVSFLACPRKQKRAYHCSGPDALLLKVLVGFLERLHRIGGDGVVSLAYIDGYQTDPRTRYEVTIKARIADTQLWTTREE